VTAVQAGDDAQYCGVLRQGPSIGRSKNFTYTTQPNMNLHMPTSASLMHCQLNSARLGRVVEGARTFIRPFFHWTVLRLVPCLLCEHLLR
jgi:hypothetical protein